MAFWGVEVKPGKPITHYCEKARGRLRISQATLAIGDATVRSTVQCNVGRRSPVLLCVLMPEKTESCHLELEFEEDDDVVFSVIGPRSVYLSGYYVQKLQGACPPNDLSVKNQNSERKRKRKRHSKKNLKIKKRSKTEEKTHTIQAAKDNNTVLAKDNVHAVEAFTNIGNSNDDLTKKRKSELQLEGISVKGTDNQCGLHHAENQTQEQLVGLEEIHTEEIGEKYQEMPVDSSRNDFQKERGENQELQIDKSSADTGPSLKQTILKGGLIVEELKSGPPNAKVAAPGKKVKIYYTAMVKETGHVFDSNVGKDALCFWLGDEQFIDGWNVGIDGMRVGEKRRLIVPPSMGSQLTAQPGGLSGPIYWIGIDMEKYDFDS
ncbi:peptidyl-prolyl cis-trans isomerase [Striga asiatica]|uniref:peptidylprolyl isomerase n=1 Tax=Striga asiatica TaxID=4170 RepID=A0A5A7QVA5_STRAF|nr:peptidyl-prolyl cis-trans isomerase [Striga asiatica]